MKKLFISGIVLFALSLSAVFSAQAQMRDRVNTPSDYSGPIVKEKDPSDGANIGNLFNMKMSHSYSVNFASFGGQYQNMNAYTNTMQFFFTDKLTGRVDLSLVHSPFGGNTMTGFDAQKEVQFILRNAELNYELNDNTTLHLQVNQYPQGYGYYPGYGGYRNSPFRSAPIFGRY